MAEEEKKIQGTPTLAKVIRESLLALSDEIRVSLPAKIVTYDFKKQKASVQPVLKRTNRDGTTIEMPVIYNVPVIHPRSGNSFVHLPLKKNDYVTLIFSDRSLDKWLTTGGNVDPEDSRKHHLSDAFAYPGGYPFSDPADIPNGDDIVIQTNNVSVRVKQNNHIQIKNQSTELIRTICDWMRAMREAITYTGIGPQKLHHLDFEDIEKRLKTFLES